MSRNGLREHLAEALFFLAGKEDYVYNDFMKNRAIGVKRNEEPVAGVVAE